MLTYSIMEFITGCNKLQFLLGLMFQQVSFQLINCITINGAPIFNYTL